MFKKISCLALIALVSHVGNGFARPLSEAAGWKGALSLNIAYINNESQLSTGTENKKIEDLNATGESTSSKLIAPLGSVYYTLDSLKTQLFFEANSADQISTNGLQYEFGIKHQFKDDSTLTFAAFPQLSVLNDVWEDPFLEGSDRTETEQEVGGARISVEQIFATPLTVKYAIANSSIESELSGQNSNLSVNEMSSLERDSLYQRLSFETMFPVAKGVFLKPNLEYTERNAEGNANSYDDYAMKLSVLVFRERYFWATTLSFGMQNYQNINPIFDDKQDTEYVGLSSLYVYKDPFGFKDWSLSALAVYTEKESDIGFYDSKSLIVVTSASYKF